MEENGITEKDADEMSTYLDSEPDDNDIYIDSDEKLLEVYENFSNLEIQEELTTNQIKQLAVYKDYLDEYMEKYNKSEEDVFDIVQNYRANQENAQIENNVLSETMKNTQEIDTNDNSDNPYNDIDDVIENIDSTTLPGVENEVENEIPSKSKPGKMQFLDSEDLEDVDEEMNYTDVYKENPIISFFKNLTKRRNQKALSDGQNQSEARQPKKSLIDKVRENISNISDNTKSSSSLLSRTKEAIKTIATINNTPKSPIPTTEKGANSQPQAWVLENQEDVVKATNNVSFNSQKPVSTERKENPLKIEGAERI